VKYLAHFYSQWLWSSFCDDLCWTSVYTTVLLTGRKIFGSRFSRYLVESFLHQIVLFRKFCEKFAGCKWCKYLPVTFCNEAQPETSEWKRKHGLPHHSDLFISLISRPSLCLPSLRLEEYTTTGCTLVHSWPKLELFFLIWSQLNNFISLVLFCDLTPISPPHLPPLLYWYKGWKLKGGQVPWSHSFCACDLCYSYMNAAKSAGWHRKFTHTQHTVCNHFK